MKTFSLKKFFAIFFLCLIPLAMLALLYFNLETYYDEGAHNECGTLLCIDAAIAFVVCSVIALCNRRRGKAILITWVASTLVLAFVFYVGNKIPFCVVCEEVTAEDLGFLTHWISPEG